MKIHKISNCKMCPSFSNYYDVNGEHYICHISNKTIGNPYKLPKWCPLPDYKEKDDENNIH